MPAKRTTGRSASSRPAQPRRGFVAVGAVVGPHGIEGEIKVRVLSDNPERFRPHGQVWAGGEAYRIDGTRWHRGALLLQLDGVRTRNQADALRGQFLEVPQEALATLPEGEYYRFELVGMDVVDTDGRSLGRLVQVLETGANDVYIVRSDEGELLLPAIDSVVKDVDVAGRRMVVEPPAGLERRPPKRARRH